jgi:hypothetical protein
MHSSLGVTSFVDARAFVRAGAGIDVDERGGYRFGPSDSMSLIPIAIEVRQWGRR